MSSEASNSKNAQEGLKEKKVIPKSEEVLFSFFLEENKYNNALLLSLYLFSFLMSINSHSRLPVVP